MCVWEGGGEATIPSTHTPTHKSTLGKLGYALKGGSSVLLERSVGTHMVIGSAQPHMGPLPAKNIWKSGVVLSWCLVLEVVAAAPLLPVLPLLPLLTHADTHSHTRDGQFCGQRGLFNTFGGSKGTHIVTASGIVTSTVEER